MSERLIDSTVHGCEPPHTCGGWFQCQGCLRIVGWCMGCGDDLPNHCDDCVAKIPEGADVFRERGTKRAPEGVGAHEGAMAE